MSSPVLAVQQAVVARAAQTARAAAARLLGEQRPDGHWCAPLTADVTLEADYILLQLWLHPPENGVWLPPSPVRVERAARAILERQLPGGGFNIYPGGPAEISATVKAYYALKLAGIPADDGRMERARRTILDLGGIQAANSYVKINLSLFGLYPREHCPSIPPEIMLLPGRFIYRMSSWTRAIAVALSVVQAAGARRSAPAGFTLEELFHPDVSPGFAPAESVFTWRNLFLRLDTLVKWWERNGPRAVRRRALRAAEAWMLERFEHSDGLGAIYPPMMYAVMALDALGYKPDHPLRRRALEQFESLLTDDGRSFFFQPCFSPVWDTANAAYALAQSGECPPEPLERAIRWLREREIRRRGDWSAMRPRTDPSGWAFEYRNDFYPDIDDTAMVLLALAEQPLPDGRGSATVPSRACQQAVSIPAGPRLRGTNWLLDLQSRDGGWAAFDADNDWTFLSHVPFADHNAMLDLTCPDITGRALEALAANGVPRDHPAVRRGVRYLERAQRDDGSWYGRWGVAYIYGTCFALRGLAAAGESDREAHILRAGEWLRSIQNADGGWGESCAAYDIGAYAPASSTPSQTAWALLGLMAGGDTSSRSVQQGIQYLLDNCRDGAWSEEQATGTGFPGVFYLRYGLYRRYFPLLALAAYAKHSRGEPHAPPGSRP